MVTAVSIEVPVPPAISETGFTLNEVVGPFVTTGEIAAVSVILPANPFRLVSVMVEVAELPAVKLAGLAALAEIPKSGGYCTMKDPLMAYPCIVQK